MNNRCNDELLLDSRIIQRNIRDGRLKREHYEKHLVDLPDLSSHCEDISKEVYSLKGQSLVLSDEIIKDRDEG